MILRWVPEFEHWYAIDRVKIPGAIEGAATADVNYALHFATKEECEAWIAKNPNGWKAVEHGWFE